MKKLVSISFEKNNCSYFGLKNSETNRVFIERYRPGSTVVDVMLTYHGNLSSRDAPTFDRVDSALEALTDQVSAGNCVLSGVGRVACTGNTMDGKLGGETFTLRIFVSTLLAGQTPFDYKICCSK